ncbi:AMP-binding protein [Adonisia turfae]
MQHQNFEDIQPVKTDIEPFPQSVSKANLPEIFLSHVHQFPSQRAYTFLNNGEAETASLTYQQLGDRVQTIAARLRSLTAPGDRALLLFSPGLEFVMAFLGCLLANVIAVPTYPVRRPQHLERLAAIAHDAAPTLILTTDDQLEQVRSHCQELQLEQIRCVAIDQWADEIGADWPPLDIAPETLAFVQYTSGSTGSPKGVMISHANLQHNLTQIQAGFGHTPQSQGVIWLPPYHDMGLIGGILQPLFVGFPVVLMPATAFLKKPIRWLQAISDYQATTSGGPNFAYDLCVQRIKPEELHHLDLSSWDVAFTGAEPVRPATIQQFSAKFSACGFRSEAFYPCYGLAEATLMVTGGNRLQPPKFHQIKSGTPDMGQDLTQSLVGCGPARNDMDVVVVDPQSHTICAAGQVGEIWVRGPSVAQGYWQQEKSPAFKACLSKTTHTEIIETTESPFLRTGDLGFLMDRELFVTGRLKDLIIIRGQNYAPEDIEYVATRSHPALRPHGSAAFSVDLEGAEALIILHEVERTAIKDLDAESVMNAIRQAISQHYELQVSEVILLKAGSLPKTSSGKIQRYICRARFLENTLTVVGRSHFPVNSFQNESTTPCSEEERQVKESATAQAPVTKAAIEDWLIQNLARYLKVAPSTIDPRLPFADYGLDSSVALNLTGELEDWLNDEIEPDVFWRYPSIRKLAEYFVEGD